MKFFLKTLSLVTLLLIVNSCGSISTFEAPLEPGQTVYQSPSKTPVHNNVTRNDNTTNSDDIPEPGQIEMKSIDENTSNNIPEPGQTEMKDEEEQ